MPGLYQHSDYTNSVKFSKIVITGGNGFVGSHLADTLSKSSYEVISIDTIPPLSPIDKVKYVISDLNELSDRILEEILKDSLLIHLAAISSTKNCENNPLQSLNVNIGLTLRLIKTANKTNTKVIFASSEWIYPDSEEPIPLLETNRLELTEITNLYSMSKLVGEWILQRYSNDYQILRFGIVYGERNPPQSAIEQIVFDAVNQSSIKVGNFSTARRFIHVQDLCSGILKCLHDTSQRKILNLSGYELISLGRVIEEAEKLLGYKLTTVVGNQTPSIRNPVPDEFVTHFNWKPQIDSKEGILRLIDFYSSTIKRR